MPKELFREIRKLEVRLEDFLKESREFVNEVRVCINKFKELNKNLEGLKKEADPKKIEELLNLRLEAIKALSKALRKESEAEHEKSHLMESYGALVLALEEEFKELLSHLC